MKIKTVYAADDGKEFATEQECLNYEYDLCQQSKVTKLKVKLRALVKDYCDVDYDDEYTEKTIADFIYQRFSEIEVIVNEFN